MSCGSCAVNNRKDDSTPESWKGCGIWYITKGGLSGPLYPNAFTALWRPQSLWRPEPRPASPTSRLPAGCPGSLRTSRKDIPMSATTTEVQRVGCLGFYLTKFKVSSLVSHWKLRAGGERIVCKGYFELLWLVLNCSEAKKGRGLPEITKLGRPDSNYYTLYSKRKSGRAQTIVISERKVKP